jgi:hypothetical protein
LLEAEVEGAKITFSPKSVVDRHLTEGLEDREAGRTQGGEGSDRGPGVTCGQA